jgi:hypothetical protein
MQRRKATENTIFVNTVHRLTIIRFRTTRRREYLILKQEVVTSENYVMKTR